MASKLAGGEVVLDHGTFKADQPPLAPKRKLKIDRKKSNVEWQWAPFTNQAREDGLVLHHWQKKRRRVRGVSLRALQHEAGTRDLY
jgi:hypothetical protein